MLGNGYQGEVAGKYAAENMVMTGAAQMQRRVVVALPPTPTNNPAETVRLPMLFFEGVVEDTSADTIVVSFLTEGAHMFSRHNGDWVAGTSTRFRGGAIIPEDLSPFIQPSTLGRAGIR